ncbi:MAG: ribbon-helix-helix domain-containing protein [Candidatus Binatia bacterium]|nr:ribbon-helix-helix domain-containing protein [Candidatus Binatia bacterium]
MAEKSEVTIKIPRPLYEKLQAVIDGTGFHSVTEFIVYVLRDLVSTDLAATGKKRDQTPRSRPAARPTKGTALTAEEVRLIRQRLRDLGYL